ncbi:MAG: hypothetical protein AAFN50_08420 [Pseudomonadota bacterium]
MSNLDKLYKLLIFSILLVIGTVDAQDAGDAASAAPVSPVQQALERARTEVRAGNQAGAVNELEALFQGGFSAIGFVMADPELASLAGYPAFDELAAKMEAQAYPCEHQDGFSDFDFWVGEWDVHVASGQFAGGNAITREQRGCVLIEQWQSVTGGTGSSINYLDKATNEWVQLWTDASGGQIHIRGGLTDDGMLLEGTIHTVANGVTLPFRGLWTPLEDGRVRQFFEQSNDDGETWVPWFEGFYTRKETE